MHLETFVNLGVYLPLENNLLYIFCIMFTKTEKS